MQRMSVSSPRTSSSSDIPMTEAHGEPDEQPGLQTMRETKTLALHPSFYILSWIFFSNVTILFNKWLIDNAGFRYPILLTCWHLIFATLATQLLAKTTSLLDSRHSLKLNARTYLRTILPIGVFYSGSLVCSNVVYLYLSVSFIQMLKSASPVAVLFFSWVWGIAHPTMSMLLNILVIVFGVAVASAGEIEFSWTGFAFQVGGTVFEAIRLVMIQVMLSSEGMKMDPLVGLYYYAPVCALMNVLVALVIEIPKFEVQHLFDAGFFMLFLNALVAFMLNIASVCLIGKTSGLVMTLTGILKSILLVIVSVMIWHTQVTLLQFIGYAIALGGLTYYSLSPEQVANGYHLAVAWTRETWKTKSFGSGKDGWTPERRRWIVIGGVLCFISMLVVVGIWQGPAALKAATQAFPSIFGAQR